jgi:hypothetical protein
MKRTKTFTHTIKYSWTRETDTHNLYLVADTYANNGTLAIIVMEVMPDGSEEQFDVITTNIMESDLLEGDNLAFIDTNNCSWAEKMLKQHKFAKDTGDWGHSGWCSYPLYEFNLDKFVEVAEEGA